jgi:hypothetical protein
MRKILIVSLAAAGLALGACSREDRTQVGEGAAAVGGEVKEAAHEIAANPEVKEAGAADASTVRSTISHQTLPSPEGVIAVDPESRHAWRNLAVGRIRSDGQVDTLWSTRGPTRPTPFPATRTRPEWTKFLVTVQREKPQRRAAPSSEPRPGATP